MEPMNSGEMPITPRQSNVAAMPPSMYGRRRPIGLVLRSLSIPAAGCTNMATARLLTRM